MSIVQAILVALIPAILVAIVSAWVTVRLSLRQFRSQRWWEKKVEAYSGIMEHLADMELYFREMAANELGEKQLSSKYMDEIGKSFHEASKRLYKAAAIGAYVVSDDAAAAIRELVKKVDDWPHDRSFYDFFETNHSSVESCIAAVRHHAKADLQQE